MKEPIQPEHMLIFAIVYHPDRKKIEKNIASFGALEITQKSYDDIIFKRHYCLVPDGYPLKPHNKMAKLITKHSDVLCHIIPDNNLAHLKSNHPKIQALARASFPIARRKLQRKLYILRTNHRDISINAKKFGIPIAEPQDHFYRHENYVADYAQALWITSICNGAHFEPEKNNMLAAFQAWRCIDELRPVIF